jgi:magnesium-protoporphyrin O-methyltransferase
MSHTISYRERLGAIETYFDRTAIHAWAALTSDAPVGRIRATVRAGREEMRRTLLSWLPDDMTGLRLLDAGCGTGALAVEAAYRGAEVVAVDIAPNLIQLARERTPRIPGPGSVDFRVGDMIDPALGTFDYVVSMDALIHYAPGDAVSALARLAENTRRSMLVTFAPRTPALATMHTLGKLFPRSDRSPAIIPVAQQRLIDGIGREPGLDGWRAARTYRVSRGFYISQGLEVTTQGSARSPWWAR